VGVSKGIEMSRLSLALALVGAGIAASASAEVRGRALSVDGNPVAGAVVTAFAPEATEARARRILAGQERPALASAKTGADGSFVLLTTEPVTTVLVRADGFAPGFTTGLQREPLTLSLEPAAVYRGTVTALGKPVPEALVVWTPKSDGGEVLTTRTGKDGAYEIVAAAEQWVGLSVLHRDFAPRTAWGDPRTRSTFSHELQRGVRIEGFLVDEKTSRGVGGATVWVDGWPLTESSADGTFTVAHAAAGWSFLSATAGALLGTAKPGAGPRVVSMRPARRLSGVVRDARTKQPLPGALVSLNSQDATSPSALAGARGQYELPSLASGRYRATVTRPGYEAAFLGGHESQLLDLRNATSLLRDFELVPKRRVTGRVLDEKARPVEGALVMLGVQGLGTSYGQGPLGAFQNRDHHMGSFDTVETPVHSARDGSFVLTVPDGLETQFGGLKMQVVALKPGHAAGTMALPPVSAAGPLVVRLSKGVTLSGRVRSEEGTPLAGVAIALGETGPLAAMRGGVDPTHQRTWARSDAEGRFAIQVQPVLHYLALHKPGYAPRTVEGFDPRRGEELLVVLQRGAEIRGQVVRHDGRGVAAANVTVQDPQEVHLASVSTGADGGFSISDLAPGAYTLVVTTDEGVSVTRPAEAPAADVRIELGPTTTVRGRVIDAATRGAVPAFQVTVQPIGNEQGEAAMGRSQEFSAEDGAFVLEHVALGASTLSVHAEGYRPHVIEDLVLSADAGAPALEVALDPGLTVRGRVTSSEGGALAEVDVSATSGGEESSATTSESGDYELKAIAPGEVALDFRKTGFRPAKRTVQVQQPARVDVTLSRGLSLRGVVVAEETGVAVANAQVQASSSAAGAESQAAATDQLGRFMLQGLSAGRYEVKASETEHGSGELHDVDVATAGPLRLVLTRSPTAVLSGTVVGLNDDEARPPAVMVFVQGEEGSDSQYGMADMSGAFRVEKAPAGRVTVTGRATYADGRMRGSVSKELTLAPGSENTTVVEFRDDLIVSGTVIRAGQALTGATVTFQAGAGAGSSSRTDSEGRYQVMLAPDTYGVGVLANDGVSYQTQYVATESATFDIDVTGATLRGLVVEAGTETPVAEAAVSVWPLGGSESSPEASPQTSAQGTFEVELREGRYRVLAAKKGYGQQVREVELRSGARADVFFELTPAEGVSVAVVDARDNRILEASVVVRDLARRIVANGHAGADKEGAVTIPLADGAYLLSVSANNYGTVTRPVTSPARGLRIGLTPGGTLLVESPRNLRGRIRLLQPDGDEYIRCWCNGIAEILLEGRRTLVEHITPGRYMLDVMDAPQGAPRPVVITEGAVTTVTIE
jgi:large repetitive protein